MRLTNANVERKRKVGEQCVGVSYDEIGGAYIGRDAMRKWEGID